MCSRMKLMCFLFVVSLLSSQQEIHAYLALTHPIITSRSHNGIPSFTSRLYAVGDDRSRIGWAIKNDFRSFLNQCTIQSFCFLMRQLHDIQTVIWIETFTQPSIVRTIQEQATEEGNYASGTFVSEDTQPQTNPYRGTILRYHGLAAINQTIFPSWEDYFLTLIKQPVETFWVNSTRPHVPNYEIEIKPASLCARLISVREQIAREWVKDLDVISTMGRQTMASYWQNVKDSNIDDTTTTTTTTDLDSPQSDDDDGHDGDNILVRPDRQNLIFLEWSPDDNDQIPSPLRKGNFDLLLLLSTQEAIHRVLNDEDRQEGAAAVTNDYLMKFYENRLQSHFAGSQPYGRADDFLEELLGTAPRMITLEVGNQEVTALIDPIRMVETILERRQEIAKEWQELARVAPDEHFQIRRMMLNRLMGIGEPMPADEEGEEVMG